mmetsp:Transcript_14156/g.33000  ORF Transcript_14156/g.33000 Transcript_14156/m.33000 type:complete len:220 (-) Transcript_14156:22-681(-)
MVIDTQYAVQILQQLGAHWKATYLYYSADVVAKVCTWLKSDKRMADLFMEDTRMLFVNPFLQWPAEAMGDLSAHLILKPTVISQLAPPTTPTAETLTAETPTPQSTSAPTGEQQANCPRIYSPVNAAHELVSIQALADLGLDEHGVDLVAPIRAGLDRWLSAQLLPSGILLSPADAVLQMAAKPALIAAGLLGGDSGGHDRLVASVKACLGRWTASSGL